MTIPHPPHALLQVVYYRANASTPEALLRHLCSHGSDSVVIDEPGGPREGRVHWARGDVVYSLQLFFVWVRSSSVDAIEDLVAMEAAANHGSTTFAREFAALKRAHTIILLVDNQRQLLGRYRHFVKKLRADLIAAGRDPDAVPVVFQINQIGEEGVPTTPTSDMAQALTWARCDHVEAFPKEKRGAKEALDRAIMLYEEMRAEHEAR